MTTLHLYPVLSCKPVLTYPLHPPLFRYSFAYRSGAFIGSLKYGPFWVVGILTPFALLVYARFTLIMCNYLLDSKKFMIRMVIVSSLVCDTWCVCWLWCCIYFVCMCSFIILRYNIVHTGTHTYIAIILYVYIRVCTLLYTSWVNTRAERD